MIGSRFLIIITLLVALILEMLPLPEQIDTYRPDWLLLVLFYWTIALPNRCGIVTAWLCGFLLDILLGSTLGINALVYSMIAFIALANYLKIRNLSLWQQAFIVALVSAFYHLTDYWVQHFLTTAYFIPQELWSILINLLMWPVIFVVLRKYRRGLRIR
ncbi:rod shape-determining protein MreD [Gayadomonas joobiniege]|uniref:rod shape-determining protein MreD n=1 Tax=Gayadomonas joobiniege TaxID=1234606 RepID=UPI000381B81E|nr:rod shape-determining protein MreD [Gayadomonas joobiniege]